MFQHLSDQRILELWQVGIATGLASTPKRTLLLSNIDPVWAAGLVDMPDPATQLLSDLQALNQVERLATGEVPLEKYLKIAVTLTAIRPEGEAFRRALDETSAMVSGQPPLPDPTKLPEYKEQIVHQDDMVPYAFLEGGYAAGDSVAKLFVPRYDGGEVSLLNGTPIVYNGTGWLITRDLLVTNHHVVNARNQGEANAGVADLTEQGRHLAAQFDYNGEGMVGSRFDAAELLAWDAKLDYAVLRLSQSPGRAPLRLAPEKLQVAENSYVPVNIIQHPEGNPKKVALRNNLVSRSTENDLRYFTDTKLGSSGSPVFDDQWRVVALHRGSTAAEGVKFQGRTTAWLNVGTHVVSILEHLKANNNDLWNEIRLANSQ